MSTASELPDAGGESAADAALEELATWLSLAAAADTPNQQLRWQLAAVLGKVLSAPPSNRLLDKIMEADQVWHRAAREKSLEYRRNPSAGSADPASFHAEMADLERTFGEVYERFARAATQGAPDGSVAEPLCQAVAHALFHFSKHLKWMHCNHEQPVDGTWRRLHQLLLLSMRRNFSARPVKLFGNKSAEANCAQLWLRAIMLATLNTGHFSPRQIDRAEDWLEDWCRRIGADPGYDKSIHHYCVDVANDTGPVRASASLNMARPLFLRTPYLHRDIMQVRPKLLEQSMTSSLGLHAMNPLKDYLDLLDHLQRMWTSAPEQAPQRASERKELPKGTGAEVVLGFKAVSALFDPDMNGAVVRSQWTVREQSLGGLGMISPMRGEATPVVHQLAALRCQGESAWQLGVVVRVMPIPSLQESRVGIRLIARKAVMVSLIEIADPAAGLERAPVRTHRIFFISGNDRVGQADSILCAAGALSPQMNLLLSTPKNEFILKVNRVVEGAIDWQRVGFQVLEKRAAIPRRPG